MAESDIITPDGTRVVIDPSRRHARWRLSEIYRGPNTGIYCPNLDDEVWDWTTLTLFRVTNVDYSTGLSELTPVAPIEDADPIDNTDIVTGAGPGYQSESWRVFINDKVTPHILDIDRRLTFKGSSTSYCKVFRGHDISENGDVISAWYDAAGNYVSENIPLELAATDNINNITIKSPKVGFTTANVESNEALMVVTYNEYGVECDRAQMLAVKSTLTRRGDSGSKVIRGIRIDSPYLSKISDNTIEFPANVTGATVTLTGVVEYRDGSSLRLPITATNGKFSLFGLEGYHPSVVGERHPVTLNYKLSVGETSELESETYDGSIAVQYYIVTKPADSTYSVKLFVYPVWSGALSGYQLEFWMYNLLRNEFFRLPAGIVEIASGSVPYDPFNYITTQKLTFSVDLSKVDVRFKAHRHVQTTEIYLRAPGSYRQTNWIISNPVGSSVYGEGIFAKATINGTGYNIDLTSGITDSSEWLTKLYRNTNPLYNPLSEGTAPAPTHFYLINRRSQSLYPISKWNALLPSTDWDLNDGELVYLRWIRRTLDGDLELGVTGIRVENN